MKIKARPVLQAIQKHLRTQTPVSVGMKEVISICEKYLPHRDWKRMAKIDYDSDVARLRSWIPRVYKKEPPPFVTVGLYFGLCNPCTLNDYGEPGRIWADMYIGMLGQYQPRDSKQKWLWGENRHYPECGYARSKALRRIYQIAYADEDEGLGNEAEYPLCLAFGALAVCSLLRSLLAKVRVEAPVGIVVGFDEGDLLTIGELTKAGFVPNKGKMI
jgi:hypothetical protein